MNIIYRYQFYVLPTPGLFITSKKHFIVMKLELSLKITSSEKDYLGIKQHNTRKLKVLNQSTPNNFYLITQQLQHFTI